MASDQSNTETASGSEDDRPSATEPTEDEQPPVETAADADATGTEQSASEATAPTDDYRRLKENPHADPVPEAFIWPEEVPEFPDDPYLEAVSLRLLHHYDIKRDYQLDGRTYQLYGYLGVKNERHAVHPELTFAEHHTREHLFVTREPRPRQSLLDELERLGDELADRWIDVVEEHHSTDFTFVIVADSIPDEVESFVQGYENRTLLQYGYYGHWQLNFVVVAPETQQVVESEDTDLGQAFATWAEIERSEPGLIGRFLRWISR